MAAELTVVNRLTVQKLLFSGDFDTVENYFDQTLRSYENGEIGEQEMARRFRSLSLQRRDLQPIFEEWVSLFPQSYSANYALGNWHMLIGWCARGTAFSHLTTKLQFETMNMHFECALPYLERAIELSAVPYFALQTGIHLESAGSISLSKSFIERAELLLHKSEILCETWLWSLQPKWGGSEQEMEDFFEKTKTYTWSEEDHHELAIEYEILQADNLRCNGDAAQAFQLMLKLVEKSRSPFVLKALGELHYWREEYPAAARYYQEALVTNPHPGTFLLLAYAYEQMQRPDQEREALEMAAILGEGHAAARLNFALRERVAEPKVADELAHWLAMGVKQYSSSAMFQEGCRHFLGLGIPINYDAAVRHWEMAAHWGCDTAAENCTGIHWDGRNGQPKDYNKARYFAQLGTELESDLCIANLGRMLYQGHGGAKDYDAAIPYLFHAAEVDDARAMATLIRALWYGHGTSVDRAEARSVLARLKVIDREEADEVRSEIYGVLGWATSLFNAWRDARRA